MASILIINPGVKVKKWGQFTPKISKLFLSFIPIEVLHGDRPFVSVGLTSYLIENGHDCKILDLASCIPFKRKNVLKKHIKHYDYLVFSTGFQHYPTVIKYAKYCREINPNIKTVIEGDIGTFMWKEILKFPFIDYTIISEGERPLHELVSGKEKSKIHGLGYKRNGKITVNSPKPIEDLNSLPFPDWENFKPIHFKKPFQYRVLTSRGCPMRCSFCAESRWYGYVRFRDPRNVGDELESLPNESPVSLSDSNFCLSKKHVRGVCEEIKSRKLKFSNLSARVHVDFIDTEILRMMKNAGFTYIFLGVESLNPVSLKALNKTPDPVSYVRKCKRLLKYSNKINLNIESAYMIPLPGQTKEDAINEIKLIKRYSHINLFYLTPFPGTPLWEELKGKLITRDFSLFDLAHLVFKSHLDEKEIREIHESVHTIPDMMIDCRPCPLFMFCITYAKIRKMMSK